MIDWIRWLSNDRFFRDQEESVALPSFNHRDESMGERRSHRASVMFV